MKRILAVTLVFSMLLSLVGCTVSIDKDALVDYVEGEVSGVVDGAIDQTKTGISNWWDGVWNKICFWKTSPNIDEVCTHINSDGELYGLNLEVDGEARCKQCDEELTFDFYFFSDYLKASQPWYKWWKRDYQNMNAEELGQALTDYLERKGHAYEAVLRDLNMIDNNTTSVLQTADNIHEGVKQADELFQLIYQDENIYDAMTNKNDRWTFYEIENAKSSVDTFRTVMSAMGAIDSIVSFGESCDKLSEEKRNGIVNTYQIEMQKIDNGIAFAQAANDITNFFYSLAGGQTISGLTPNPEDYKEKIKDLEYATVSHYIFLSLSDLNLSKADENICVEAFRSNGAEDIQVQKDRWPAGPTANQTKEYISQLGEEYELLPCWYFYLGWRIEYECVNVIQMILDDKIQKVPLGFLFCCDTVIVLEVYLIVSATQNRTGQSIKTNQFIDYPYKLSATW